MLKKLSIFCFLVLIVTVFSQSNVYAQSAEVIICTGYNNDQSPTGANTAFTMGKDGGVIDVMVKCPSGCDSVCINYLLYKDGKYVTTIFQDTKEGWTWWVQGINIYEEGNWRVDVASALTGQVIGQANFTMSFTGNTANNNPGNTGNTSSELWNDPPNINDIQHIYGRYEWTSPDNKYYVMNVYGTMYTLQYPGTDGATQWQNHYGKWTELSGDEKGVTCVFSQDSYNASYLTEGRDTPDRAVWYYDRVKKSIGSAVFPTVYKCDPNL